MRPASTEPRPPRRSTTESTGKILREDGEVEVPTKEQAKPSRGFFRLARRWLRGAFFDNAPIKLVALVLAITVFILVQTEQGDQVIGVVVGVSYNMPEDRVLVSERVDQLRITIKGSKRRIKRFDARELDRVQVDLRNSRTGEYVFQQDMIKLPTGIELLSINPQTMHLQFEKESSKSVPVSVKTVGEPRHGYKLERKVANPSHVTVRGAESVVAAISEVRTIRISLNDSNQESFREMVALVAPENAKIIDVSEVEVDISLVEALDRLTVGPLAIVIQSGTDAKEVIEGVLLEPAEVTVVLHGSLVAIEKVKDDINPYIKLFPADIANQRLVDVMVDVEGVGHEVKPHKVKVRKK